MTREISRILRGAEGSERRVVARVTVNRGEPGVWRVMVAIEHDSLPHERTFQAESCEAAVDAVALILAIAVNPQAKPLPGSAPSLPSAPPPPLSPTTPPPPPTFLPTEATIAASPASWSPPTAPRGAGPGREQTLLRGLTVEVSAAGDVGSLPALVVGGELGVGWRFRHLRFEAAGAYWAPETRAAGKAGAQFRMVSGELRAVATWPVWTFTVGPLAAVGVEGLSAVGFGGTLSNERPDEVFGSAAIGGLAAWNPVGHVALRLALESLFPLSRPSFVVVEPSPAPSPTVHRPSAAAGRATLGAEIQF